MTELHALNAAQIAAGVRGKQFTATAVATALLDRVSALNPKINAYTLVTAERALREAAAVDAKLAAGQDPGPLAGVPYSVKDLFDLQGEITLAGSIINRDSPAAAEDATAVARLRAAGAVCLGATNMGEYAYDFVTINSHHGATRNPHDVTRSAGGSSGGSGASVAAAMATLSLGTDTNGSIRVPASFCGIWGLKPTYGRLSRAGAFPFVSSLDTIGVYARSVQDLVTALDAMSGPDARDAVCTREVWPRLQTVSDDIASLRIARLGGYFLQGDPAVQEAAMHVQSALQSTSVIELPQPELAKAAAFIITAVEGADFHRQRLASRASDFDPAARDRFIAGTLLPVAWYQKAQRYRAWWRDQMADIFSIVDVLIAPCTPLLAPELTQQTFRVGDQELPLRANIGLLTQPLSLIGLPVVAAPVQRAGSLPTAVQLIGRPGSEAALLRVARHLEQAGMCAAAVATV